MIAFELVRSFRWLLCSRLLQSKILCSGDTRSRQKFEPILTNATKFHAGSVLMSLMRCLNYRNSQMSSRPQFWGVPAFFSDFQGVTGKVYGDSPGLPLPSVPRLRNAGQRQHQPHQIDLPRKAVFGEHVLHVRADRAFLSARRRGDSLNTSTLAPETAQKVDVRRLIAKHAVNLNLVDRHRSGETEVWQVARLKVGCSQEKSQPEAHQ